MLACKLVIAADVFIYVGALEAVFASVRQRLAPCGCFAFSVERADAGQDLLLQSMSGMTMLTGGIDIAKYNDQQAVYLGVWPLVGVNEIDVAHRLREEMERIRPTLPKDIDMMMLRLLGKKPEHRYATWSEFATDLSGAVKLVLPDGSNAVPLLLEDEDPFFVPTLGFIMEF